MNKHLLSDCSWKSTNLLGWSKRDCSCFVMREGFSFVPSIFFIPFSLFSFLIFPVWFCVSSVLLLIFSHLFSFLLLHACLVTQLCFTLCHPMDYSHQAPLSLRFPRQEYWSRLPFLPPGFYSYLYLFIQVLYLCMWVILTKTGGKYFFQKLYFMYFN